MKAHTIKETLNFNREEDLRDTLKINVHDYEGVLRNFYHKDYELKNIRRTPQLLVWGSSVPGNPGNHTKFRLNFRKKYLRTFGDYEDWDYKKPIESAQDLKDALYNWFSEEVGATSSWGHI